MTKVIPLFFYTSGLLYKRQMIVVLTVEVELSCQLPIIYFKLLQIASEEQSGKMISSMKMHMKQKFIIKFLYTGKNCTGFISIECLWRPNIGCTYKQAMVMCLKSHLPGGFVQLLVQKCSSLAKINRQW